MDVTPENVLTVKPEIERKLGPKWALVKRGLNMRATYRETGGDLFVFVASRFEQDEQGRLWLQFDSEYHWHGDNLISLEKLQEVDLLVSHAEKAFTSSLYVLDGWS